MGDHLKQKNKTDPYKLFLKITIIIAAVSVFSLGVFLICNAWVDTEYDNIVNDIYEQNIADEEAFNAELEALRESAAETEEEAEEETDVELETWEAELDDSTWEIQDEGSAGLDNTYTITVTNSSLCEGGLMLVNAWHSVPDYFSEDNLVSIGTASGWTIPVTDSDVKVFTDAYNALQDMYDDATAEGMTDYIVREGYRTNEEQTELFTSQTESLSDQYSGNALIEKAKETVNYPGTSEYQTGLSFRMGLYNSTDATVASQEFQETEEGQWFTNNCWKYGVIFRFPTADFPSSDWEDKSYKTGVTVELNLYRYVGKAHSVAMKILDYCLEEYIDFLIDHPHITIYQDGVLVYEIVRISITEQDSYELPVTSLADSYTASIDNMGGIVMSYAYEY